MTPNSSKIKAFLRVIIYPWFFWFLSEWVLSRIKFRLILMGAYGKFLYLALRGAFFICIGLPIILLITTELTIRINEMIVGEQTQFRFNLDKSKHLSQTQLRIPGPPAQSPSPLAAQASREQRYQYLLERHAPVLIQKIAHRPEWDIPLPIDFDGNDNPRDNVKNEPAFRPHHAGLHAEVTAETNDSYYLQYSVYHVKDYDHPIRQILSKWTYHDGDHEGIMLRVDKKTDLIEEMSCWFHNRFFLATRTGEGVGNEPVQGKIFFESETHPIIFCTPMGHGVQAAQTFDGDYFKDGIKIFRYSPAGPYVSAKINRENENNLTYSLKGYDTWYRYARGPFGKKGEGEGMFEESFVIGKEKDGTPLRIGRFIAGIDYAKHSWVRPKPSWSWDDGWDALPIFIWNFYPSYAFQSSFGKLLSHEYITNRPVEKTFQRKAEELFPLLQLSKSKRGGSKWESLKYLEKRPSRGDYKRALKLAIKKYINRLFSSLG